MKLISWNVNGLRACAQKGFAESVLALDADVIAIQETKMREEQADIALPGYERYFHSADKAGYSGTAIYTRVEPMKIERNMGIDAHDHEGRILRAEFKDFQLVCCYTPNSQRGLTRLEYRMQWEDVFQDYCAGLARKKPVIVCGDLNVAAQPIDLKNPDSNHKNAGFTDEERAKFQQFLDHGFVDSFRSLYPDKEGAYTWWSYMFKARERNAGWRIDYFLVSQNGKDRIQDVIIHNEVMGSDHCPVELEWK
ncbi:exodeoxyribonuclease III [Acidaminococcus fermentans]|uniref:exodeoxyribonuclease III n=1 Tax=Acidaminococcus fermentans TaxID=905 RepID=UPI00243270BD|nr:exodeoxyribonuclease III [Acidaminococcus fermentans]MDD6287578.1 exodeoxyribonuclease III [Acidaminococcus fermentans]